MNNTNPFIDLTAKTTATLAQGDRFPAAGHYWEQSEIDALIFAYSARRPLLVRGEAGSGKSQIARAAAAHLKCGEPLIEVIHPRFEALDLLYRVDVVERLADAQINQLDRTHRKYVKPGCLWQALYHMNNPDTIPVLLIDEIDKADADLPNALLDVLGNRSFNVPPLGNCTIHASDHRWPLIIITTNEERELPPAFIRRCAVLNLNPPTDNDNLFIEWLIERGRVHSHLNIADEARCTAAKQVLEDRNQAAKHGYPKVGLAEYIDLLTALHELTANIADETQRKEKQIEWLRKLSAYGLVKHHNQDQNRTPVVSSATTVST